MDGRRLLEPETVYKMKYLNAIKSVFGVAKHQ